MKQRWETWNHGAPWPEIVRGVSLVEATDTGWHTRSLGDPGTFDLHALLPAEAVVDTTFINGKLKRR